MASNDNQLSNGNILGANNIEAQALKLEETGAGTGKITLQAPNTVTPYSITFPGAQGTAGQVPVNDGSGNLSWTTPSGSGTVTGTGTATEVAFWTSSSGISSDSKLYWDNTTKTLGIGASPLNANRLYVKDAGITGSYLAEFHADDDQPYAFATYNDTFSTINPTLTAWSENDGDALFGNSQNKDLMIYTNGGAAANSRITIKNTGVIGIGTNTPGEWVTIQPTVVSGQVSAIQFNTNDSSSRLIIGAPNSSNQLITGSVAGDSCFRNVTASRKMLFSVDNGSTSAVSIIAGGAQQDRVGINNIAPAKPLDVIGPGNDVIGDFGTIANGTNFIRIHNGVAGRSTRMYVNTFHGAGGIETTGATTHFSINVNGAGDYTNARMIIESSSDGWMSVGNNPATPGSIYGAFEVRSSSNFPTGNSREIVHLQSTNVTAGQGSVFISMENSLGSGLWKIGIDNTDNNYFKILHGIGAQTPFTIKDHPSGGYQTNINKTAGTLSNDTPDPILLVDYKNISEWGAAAGFGKTDVASGAHLYSYTFLGTRQLRCDVDFNGGSYLTSLVSLNTSGGAGVDFRILTGSTQRMYIDATTGEVKFGTSNQFIVNSSGNLTKVNNVTYSWPASQGAASTVLTNDGSGNLSWAAAGGGGGTVTGTGSNGAIAFWTTSSNISEDPTQFFWDASSNRLGIGTNTPANTLSIGAGSPFQIDSSGRIFSPLGAGGAGTLSFSFLNDTDTGFYCSGTNEMRFQTAGTDRITIASTGNVGINQTSPSARLHVTGDAIVTSDFTVDTTTLVVDATNNRVGFGTASPLSAVDIQGGYTVKRNAKSASYTLTGTDYYVPFDTSGGAYTATLPSASSVGAGKFYIIKDSSGNAATNNLTVDGNASDTIDGALTYVINTNYASITLISDGVSNWEVV